MPELPEVETTRRGIEPWLRGQRIVDWTIRNPMLRWPVEIPGNLRGQAVLGVLRRGKYILIDTAIGQLIVHLGMSGSLRVLKADEPPKTHDHVDLQLASGTILRLNDPRRFGCVLFHSAPAVEQGGKEEHEEHWLLRNLGVEPLSNEFSGTYLHKLSRNRKVAIKNFIMDGKVVVGVGNIYAAEALFLAGIRPATAARRIPLHAYEALCSAIREVLNQSLRDGGTTLRDFVGSDGNPGYFRQRLNVYGRQDQPCRLCGTKLTHQVLGQRATVYCRNCQSSQGFRAKK